MGSREVIKGEEREVEFVKIAAILIGSAVVLLFLQTGRVIVSTACLALGCAIAIPLRQHLWLGKLERMDRWGDKPLIGASMVLVLFGAMQALGLAMIRPLPLIGASLLAIGAGMSILGGIGIEVNRSHGILNVEETRHSGASQRNLPGP